MVQKTQVMKAVHKKAEQLNKLIQETYIFNLETYYIPRIQEIIMQEYDIELTGRVIDRKSRTNPIYYRDEFEEALLNFEWIETEGGAMKLVTPETNTFDWRQGRLRIIEKILEGLVGRYVEVDGQQYITMYDKPPIGEPFDKTVPRKQRIYTLRATALLKRKWSIAFPKKPLVNYPFSNQPPIDIFDAANQYVKEEIRGWIDEAIKEATKEIAK